MRIIERNVQEIGKSLLITLPRDWARLLRLRKGSRIKLLVSDSGDLSIAPEFIPSTTERKESSFAYDKHFPRRFFREYFFGNEKITITLDRSLSEKERAKFYAFLKLFMNVQVIEETVGRIVVKCFRIDELTIEECLRRMFYLSLNMLDEAAHGKDKLQLDELYVNLKKFYYMLVMQIRRYLSEGKFTENKQIPLIRAMDCRMVAERIERIAGVLSSIGQIDAVQSRSLAEMKAYYSKACNYFLLSDYVSSMQLYGEHEAYHDRFQRLQMRAEKQKNIRAYKTYGMLLSMLRYTREISMLVR